MTAQSNDTILIQGNEYGISGIDGKGLFDPADHGLTTAERLSTLWRGYLCAYEVVDDQLTLKHLFIFLDVEQEKAAKRGDGPLLFGNPPSDEPGPVDSAAYRNLGVPLAFTGGLLLTSGFIQALYVHMGFHPAWKYREAYEARFDAGQLTNVMDLSTLMAEFRELVKGEPLRPGLNATREEIEQWVKDCFSLDYR